MYYRLVDKHTVQSSCQECVTPTGRVVLNLTKWLDHQSQKYRIDNGWYEIVHVDQTLSLKVGYKLTYKISNGYIIEEWSSVDDS